MTEGAARFPTVFTVDSYHTTPPPLPPRPGRRRQVGLTQVLLFLLVTVALCGMVVEAWLIYRLYYPPEAPTAVAMPSAAKRIGNAPDFGPEPTKWSRLVETPSKPLAHLTDGHDVSYKSNVMSWSDIGDPLLYRVVYKENSLVFQESGYYYIYCKVSFHAEYNFYHSIELKTKYYYGNKNITILTSKHTLKSTQSNSFLAGIFYFYKGDAIFVKVNDISLVARHDSYENVFGAYMI